LKCDDKKRINRLITDFIKQVAIEEVCIEDADTAENVVITKAEALARQIWDRALGVYKELDLKTGKIKTPPPDKAMIQLIMDRMEGKVADAPKTKDKDAESIPDMISRKNKERLNKL
jgi:hypothetical protein